MDLTHGAVPRNRLLAAIPPETAKWLAERLEAVPLARGTFLTHPDVTPAHVHFPDAGLASLVKVMGDGRTAEVGAVGIDGMVGIAPALGMGGSAYETIMQVSGRGRRLATALVREAAAQDERLKSLLLRYMSFRENQLAQTAACNRLHSLRQRCCRWLLTVHDNAEGDAFALTHDFLALMMGVNRPTLSIAVEALQRQHIIRYPRASLTILDRSALQAGACECYEYLRHASERVYRS